MSGLLYYFMIALIGMLNPFLASLGVFTSISSIHTTFTTIMTSTAKDWLMAQMSIIYWFLPKSFLHPLIVASFVILGLRFAVSIWHAVKW